VELHHQFEKEKGNLMELLQQTEKKYNDLKEKEKRTQVELIEKERQSKLIHDEIHNKEKLLDQERRTNTELKEAQKHMNIQLKEKDQKANIQLLEQERKLLEELENERKARHDLDNIKIRLEKALIHLNSQLEREKSLRSSKSAAETVEKLEEALLVMEQESKQLREAIETGGIKDDSPESDGQISDHIVDDEDGNIEEEQTTTTAAVRPKQKYSIQHPDKDDEVGAKLADVVKANPVIDDSIPNNMFKIDKGLYQFGTKQIHVQVVDKDVMVRVGGGYMKFIEFVDRYGKIECQKAPLDVFDDLKKKRMEDGGNAIYPAEVLPKITEPKRWKS